MSDSGAGIPWVKLIVYAVIAALAASGVQQMIFGEINTAVSGGVAGAVSVVVAMGSSKSKSA